MNNQTDSHSTALNESISDRYTGLTLIEHFSFLFYCFLLCIPGYAIVMSAISENWLMMVVDILLVPVGFVHGLLLIFGLV